MIFIHPRGPLRPWDEMLRPAALERQEDEIGTLYSFVLFKKGKYRKKQRQTTKRILLASRVYLHPFSRPSQCFWLCWHLHSF